MRCKAMTQGVATSVLRDSRFLPALLNRRLNRTIGDVMTSFLSAARVNRSVRGWKNVANPTALERSDICALRHKVERLRHNRRRDPLHAALSPFADDA